MREFFNKYSFPMTVIAIILVIVALLGGCGAKTADDRIKEQISEKVHALTADERLSAQTNAKQFYEKQWPQMTASGKVEQVNGYFTECRPSDSNFNGLVTCFGKIPDFNGGFKDVKRYCGYQPGLVGCSDEDTVK